MEEVAGIKEAFDMMDVEKRGKINLEELKRGLQKLGQQIPETDLQILMEAVCTYNSLLCSTFVSLDAPCICNLLSWIILAFSSI